MAGTSHNRVLLIDGVWTPSAGTETIDVIDPRTERVVGTVPAGVEADVDRAAAAAARMAFETYRMSSIEDRLALLDAIIDEYRRRSSSGGLDVARRCRRWRCDVGSCSRRRAVRRTSRSRTSWDATRSRSASGAPGSPPSGSTG